MSPRAKLPQRRTLKRQYVGTIRANFAKAPEPIRDKVLEIINVAELPNKKGLMALGAAQLRSAARLLDCWQEARSADRRKIGEEIHRLKQSSRIDPDLATFAARQPDLVCLALLRWAIKAVRCDNNLVGNPNPGNAPRSNCLANGSPCLGCNPEGDLLLGWTAPQSPDGLCEACRELGDSPHRPKPFADPFAGFAKVAADPSRRLWLLMLGGLERESPTNQLVCSLCQRVVPETEAWTIKKQWRKIPKPLSGFFDRHFQKPLCGDCGWVARNKVKHWRRKNPEARWNPFWTHRWLEEQGQENT